MTQTVFLHGAGMDCRIWDAVMEGAPPDWQAPDLPGHGSRAVRPAAASIQAIARSAEALLPDGPLVLVGHSMGALVALALAGGAVADRVEHLVLVNAADCMPVGEKLLQAAAATPQKAAEMVARNAFAPTAEGWSEMQQQAWRQMLDQPAGAAAADFTACNAFDDAENLAMRVMCPVTVLTGEHDRLSPPEGGRALAGLFAHGRLTMVAGVGHMVPLEAPDMVVKTLKGAPAAR